MTGINYIFKWIKNESNYFK